MKYILIAILCSTLLIGCSSNTNKDNLKNESTYGYSQSEIEEIKKQENAINHELEDNGSEADEQNNLGVDSEYLYEENNEVAEGPLKIETEYFVENMDKIFDDIDEYEGRTLTYEGLLIEIDGDSEEYAVVRTYEVDHGDHSHSIYVGLDVQYDGDLPDLNSWVEVTGKIQKANEGGEDYPTLKIEEITVLPEQGELVVTN